MKKTNIIVVYSSHLGDEHNKKFNDHIENTIGCTHKIVPYENFNEHSLTSLYNKAIDEHNEENSIMIFCHNDIKFISKGWGRQLLTKFNFHDYQIIGVAGTTSIPVTGRWWDEKDKMIGIVEHTDGFRRWVSEYSKPFHGIKPVSLIDGLFMAVDCNDIEAKFDEDFDGFHFYDVSFSFENYLEGCNVGVVTDIRILHESLGETNEEWEKNRILFVHKNIKSLTANL